MRSTRRFELYFALLQEADTLKGIKGSGAVQHTRDTNHQARQIGPMFVTQRPIDAKQVHTTVRV